MTLIAENDDGVAPSLEDLQDWANTYDITHPVLADPGYEEILKYLWADPSFTGSIGLPTKQLLAPGMVVNMVDEQVQRTDVEALIEEE